MNGMADILRAHRTGDTGSNVADRGCVPVTTRWAGFSYLWAPVPRRESNPAPNTGMPELARESRDQAS